MRLTILAEAVLFSMLLTYSVKAQSCCGVGNAIATSGHPSLVPGTFLVQSGYNYSKLRSLEQSRKVIPLGIAYGIMDNLSIIVKTNYAWLHTAQIRPGLFDTTNGKIDTLKNDTTFTFNNDGFGDGTIGLQYVIIPLNFRTRMELKAGADIGIPWARSDRSGIVDGMETKWPASVQTGSGFYSTGAYISFNKVVPTIRLGATIMTAGKIKFSNPSGEKQGNEFSLSITGVAGPFFNTRQILAVSYRNIGAAIDNKGETVAGTGGERVDLSPSFELGVGEHVKLSAGAGIPLWLDEYQKAFANTIDAQLTVLLFIPTFTK